MKTFEKYNNVILSAKCCRELKFLKPYMLKIIWRVIKLWRQMVYRKLNTLSCLNLRTRNFREVSIIFRVN